jgi:hypothetical protein
MKERELLIHPMIDAKTGYCGRVLKCVFSLGNYATYGSGTEFPDKNNKFTSYGSGRVVPYSQKRRAESIKI